MTKKIIISKHYSASVNYVEIAVNGVHVFLADLKNQRIGSSIVTHILPVCGLLVGIR